MHIVFANPKGGAGKTTCCAAIATSLAIAGDKVLVLELDPRRHFERLARKIELPSLSIEAVTPDAFTDRFRDARTEGAFDHILVDTAGIRDTTFLHAIARADLVVIPLIPGEQELHEVVVVARDITDLAESANRPPIPFRVLLTRLHHLASSLQTHILAEVRRLGLPRFEAAFFDRVSYREVFMTGLPAEQREPAAGAGPEIRAVIAEIKAIEAASHGPTDNAQTTTNQTGAGQGGRTGTRTRRRAA